MNKLVSLGFVCLFAFAAMIACKSGTAKNTVLPETNDPMELSGRWTLVSIMKHPDLKNEGGKEVYMEFNTETKQMEGNTGCNHMFSAYKADASTLSFDGVGATEMYCEGVKTEQPLMEVLRNVNGYSIVADVLTLRSGSEAIASFRRSATE